MLLANETVAAHLVDARRAGAAPRARGAGPQEGGGLRGVHHHARLQPGGAAARAAAEALPEADRPDARHAGGAADRRADAADDAEGAVRRREPRPLRPGGGALHALHVADPPVSGPRRAPHAARVAARRRSPAARREELEEELPEVARHTSEMERRADEAERELLQWKKVRFMADKVGDEYDGYITGVAPFGLFVELDRALRRRAWCTSRAWPTTTTASSSSSTSCAGRTRRRSTGWATRCSVQVVRVDMERRQVDLGLVEILEAVRREERPRGPVRSKVKPKRATGGRSGPGGGNAPRGRRGRRRRGGSALGYDFSGLPWSRP